MTSRKKKAAARRSFVRSPALIAFGVLAVVALAAGVWLFVSPASSGPRALNDSETAFSVSDVVGQPAPTFTATDANGQPFTFTPGDGRPKALVFYMGYG